MDEDQLVLTVRLASTSANSTGWTRLGVVASRQVQAKMARAFCLPTRTTAFPRRCIC